MNRDSETPSSPRQTRRKTPFAENPRGRRAQSIYPQEQSARQSNDGVAIAKIFLQRGEQRVDNLAIGVIERVADPKVRDQRPLRTQTPPRPSVRRRRRHSNSRIGSPVPSSNELAILMGRPIGVSYSLVQSIPKAL